MPKPLVYRDGEPFPGRVGTTFVESTPAWPIPRRAPAGAPNVVLVVLDDVGFAQLGCFGSDIHTPTFDRLAADGLRYRRFHTTAMCSPTRACLLTGRNPHTCAMGGIPDMAMGFPSYHGRIPRSCGFVSEVLRQAGWATLAVGKWHLAPSDEHHAAAPHDRWPPGVGLREPEELAPNVKMRPHRIVVDIEIGAGGAEGVLVAQGGRFGGYSLYVHDGRLHYTTNFAGIERTTVSSPAQLAPGRHVVGVALDPAGAMGMRAELSVGGEVVAAEAPRTAPFRFALAGEGLCCGYDDDTPVADVYQSPFAFTGTIHEAVIDVSGTPVPLRDLVAEVRRAWMTQ